MPKGSYKFESTPGITRFLDILKNEFAENPRWYPEGGNKSTSGSAVFMNNGALDMLKYGYPYISVNELKKLDQWLNLNDPANHSATDTNNVKNNTNKGAQFAIFNERLPDEGTLKFNSDDLTIVEADVKSTKQWKPGGGASYEFPYIPAASGNPLTFELTYTKSDTITRESTSGSSGNWSNSTQVNLSLNTKTKFGFVENAGGLALTDTLQFGGAWNQALKEGTSTITGNTLKIAFSPSNFKEGSKISDIVTPPQGVKIMNPNDVLESGGTYIAQFVVTQSDVSAPSSGITKISGTSGVIAPRSMQYQSAGKDKGRINWSSDGTQPGGILEGRNAAFWAKNFILGGGVTAYDLEDGKIRDGDKILTQPAVSYDENAGTASVLNLARMSAQLNYDVKLQISRVHDNSNNQLLAPSNALMQLNSVLDLDDIGQDNMSDYYKGSSAEDLIDGTEEGADIAETGDGNDHLTNFRNSYIDTGVGNDTVTLDSSYGENQVYTGGGDDYAEIESPDNNIDLGVGSDQIKLYDSNNSIDLGSDADQDVVINFDQSGDNSGYTNMVNLDLGQDSLLGFGSTDVLYSYDALHQKIKGIRDGQTSSDPSFKAWLHTDEDINLNQSSDRLFLQLLSSNSLNPSDRVFIETKTLTPQQLDGFIERFVFNDQSVGDSALSSNSLIGTSQQNSTESHFDLNGDFKQLLSNPDFKSLGSAIWDASSDAAEGALKPLLVAKLTELGIPKELAIDLVDTSFSIAKSSLESAITTSNALATPSDAALIAAADRLLTELSSRMEHEFHTKAFPTEQIDSLTGLAITPSPDNDAIDGTDLNDWLRAGAGNDLINAGAGNDAVRAGTGSDQITLGSGADALVISYDQLDGATDTLTDFNINEDRLLLEEIIQVEQISASQLRLFTTGTSGEEERELTVVFGGGMNYVLDVLPIERFSIV